MATEASAADITSYEFEPFELIFLQRRSEILRLVGLTSYALRSLKGSARLAKVLGRSDEQVNSAHEIETLAATELKSDLPLLHSAAAVLIWGALETALRDFLVRWLVTYPSLLTRTQLKEVRIRVSEYESLTGEDRMRFLLGKLQDEFGRSSTPGVSGFASILEIFSVNVTVAPNTRRDLNELAALRNVIVHRAGVADARLRELCPWLNVNVGASVRINGSDLDRYVKSASEYAVAVIMAARDAAKTLPARSTAAQLADPAAKQT